MKLSSLSMTASALAMMATPILATEVQPIGTGRPDHQLIYEVIEDGLVALGHSSDETLIGAYPAIHLAIAQGDADYTAVHWVPLHNAFYDNAGGAEVFVRAGPTYT
ncbi:MAG: hypothetical protein KJZ59_11280, partial [Pararhodobacter sp.]|nr:hypothetical protein [Pararhodobacter sp.]